MLKSTFRFIIPLVIWQFSGAASVACSAEYSTRRIIYPIKGESVSDVTIKNFLSKNDFTEVDDNQLKKMMYAKFGIKKHASSYHIYKKNVIRHGVEWHLQALEIPHLFSDGSPYFKCVAIYQGDRNDKLEKSISEVKLSLGITN